jgi:hypothetical protein
VAVEGCLAVISLASQNDTNKTQFGNLNTPDLLISALYAHVKVIEPTLASLQALVCLISNHAANLRATSYANYCILLLNVMRIHKGSSAPVCLYACLVLYHLTKSPQETSSVSEIRNDNSSAQSTSSATSQTNRAIISDDVVLSNYARDPRHLPQHLTVEQQRFFIRQNVTDLINGGVCDVLVDVLQRYCGDAEDVVVAACNVVYQLAKHDTGNEALTWTQSSASSWKCESIQKFRVGNFCSLLPRLLQQYAVSASMTCLLCHISALMCQDPICQSQLGKNGVAKILVAIVQQHLQSVNVVELACKAIYILAVNNEPNRLKIVAAGGVDIIVIAMQLHSVGNIVPLWGSMTIEVLGNLLESR